MCWRVLQPPTGTGKTQGTSLFAALQADLNQTSTRPVGILIVTRLIAQADEVRDTINALSASGRAAIAKHSENKVTLAEAADFDVLVITHQAYVSAVSDQGSRFSDLISWRGGLRLLTIIDEALANSIEHAQITPDSVAMALGMISTELRREYPKQVQALERVHDLLSTVDELQARDGAASQRFVWRGVEEGRIEFPASLSMAPLREAMRQLPFDRTVLKKDSPGDRQRLAN